jgi:hypothetical protein
MKPNGLASLLESLIQTLGCSPDQPMGLASRASTGIGGGVVDAAALSCNIHKYSSDKMVVPIKSIPYIAFNN